MGDNNTDPPMPDEQPTLFSAEMQHCETKEVETVVYIMPDLTAFSIEEAGQIVTEYLQNLLIETDSMPLRFTISKGETIIAKGAMQ